MNNIETLKMALEALELHGQQYPHMVKGYSLDAITALRQAIEQAQQAEPVVWMYQNKSTHEVRFQKHMRSFVDHSAWYEVPLYSEPLANQEKTSGSPIKQVLAQQAEPVAWGDLQKQAQQIVESKFVWKKFIDGTPLSNDIACWMADFAQQYTSPPPRQPLTDEEIKPICDEYRILFGGWVHDFARAIEAKFKEKNT